MPEDHKDAEHFSRLLADLLFYKNAVARAGSGERPTVDAAKYVDDLELMLRMAGLEPDVLPAPEKSQMERDLEHDFAGRVERNPKRS